MGNFELIGPGGPIDLGARKLCGLLAMLACAPAPPSRERLMAMFWGSHFDAQARQNLRQALTRLRRVLGEDALVTNVETVALRPGVIASDVARFEALVADGSRDALNAAVDLYRDALLADISIPEEAWTEWLDDQRRRLEGLALDAMVKLGDSELAGGNHEQALKAANRAVTVNSLREDAHRLIMRALVAGGRRADALKHYDDLSALLNRELKADPDPSTRALAAELRGPLAKRGAERGAEPGSALAPERSALQLPDRPSIAVLPFTNMSGDADQEYFVDGIAEDILTALSKWRWLLVLARNSTFTFKGQAVSVRQVGDALGARYVLEGSVRKAGSRVRISAQLIEAATEWHIWADRYDRDVSDVFAAQDEITRQVVNAIDPAIQVSELDQIGRKPPGSLDAWDHFLRGSYHRNLFTERDAALALHHLNQAIETDPHFAAAHARLALLHVNLATLNPSADTLKALATALQLAERAIALDALDASAHGAAAYVLVYLRRHDAALQAARRAVELNGNYHPGHYALGLALLFGASAHDAIAEFEMTARLSPRDPAMWAIRSYQSLAQYTAGHYQAALDTADRAVAERPSAGARTVRIAALARLDRRAEAATALAELPKEALLRMPYLAPFRNPVDWEHWCTALEAAGWERKT